jgi:flagellar biosynthesis repressor protein FlbT
MALKVELKPGERFILGNSVITNDKQRTKLFIEGDAPVLREKDIIRAEEADTPCKKIYVVLQMMYLSDDIGQHQKAYFSLVNEVQTAAPSFTPYFVNINNEILTGAFYKALKEAQALIAYEGELLDHAKRS